VAEIDAPEKGQSWGNRSKQHLPRSASSVLRSCGHKPDRYGRTVARVECDGTDASAEQVHFGSEMNALNFIE
jgi:endonuclease YncB( thermonuclease family)